MIIAFFSILALVIILIWCKKTSHTKEESNDIYKALKDKRKQNNDYISTMWGNKE